MTPEEVIKLCRYIKAACPNQAFDEYTTDVWAEILPPRFTLGECRAAVIAIKQRQPYVDVSDVIAEVWRHEPPVGQTPVQTLLGEGSYRAEIERKDRAFLGKLGLRGRDIIPKAIEGPKSTQAPPGRVILDDQEVALRQAATSRRERGAREAAAAAALEAS